jgi:hypothetical protein
MFERGARSLIFLSRSGDAKPEAASLVRELRTGGVHVAVIVGDASVKKDVQRAVAGAQFPIKGVVQSAMVLRVYALLHETSHNKLAYTCVGFALQQHVIVLLSSGRDTKGSSNP